MKITRRADGRFVGTYSEQGKQKFVYGHSEAEVRRKLETHHAPELPRTVGAYIQWWLPIVAPTLKATTLESYTELLTLHVVPTLGPVKLEALTPIHLASLYAQKLKSQVGARRIGMVHACLRKALNDAVQYQLLSDNPCLRVAPPKAHRVRPQLWSPEDVTTFVQSELAHPGAWTPLWLTLLGTGARLGEMLGLTWSQVDLAHRRLLIDRGLSWVNGVPTIATPKSESSVRTLALPELVVRVLEPTAAESGYVFLTAKGTHPRLQNLLRFFHASCRRARVRELRIHDLRHVSASVLVASGADVKSVQKRLGHASLSTTLGIYTHVLTSNDTNLATTMELAFNMASSQMTKA